MLGRILRRIAASAVLVGCLCLPWTAYATPTAASLQTPVRPVAAAAGHTPATPVGSQASQPQHSAFWWLVLRLFDTLPCDPHTTSCPTEGPGMDPHGGHP